MTDSLHDRVVAALGPQYDLEGEIGRGGMSVVYRARDRRLNRLVAIKVLPPELAYDPAIRTRFTREAQTSAQLSHAHIVPIYDVGDRDGIAHFVMAMVTGGNLATLLAREPRQPIDEVRRIVCEIADALAYAHLRGVIHRDIKPDNILLDRDSGRAMVTDFGIARAMEGGSRLTLTGIAVGTPTYMSPEQAEGVAEVDGRSDIYSLGVLAYQMLTGRVPFTSGTSMGLLLKHVTERPRPIEELRPDTPKDLRDVIERALMKSPDDRWPTADAMRDALVSNGAPVAAWRTEQREPVRYTTPRPESARRDRSTSRSPSPRRGSLVLESRLSTAPASVAPDTIVLEPEHLASLTPEQRADLRLWHGRVNLLDRIETARGYALMTLAAIGLGIAGFIVGVEEAPPLVLSPLVPVFMSFKLWKRGKSLRASGLKLRRVFLMPRAHWVLTGRPSAPTHQRLEKLAPREVLAGPQSAAITRAAEDRAAILNTFASLTKSERASLPDVVPTANALVERVVHLAQMLYRLEGNIDPRPAGEVEARIAEVRREGASPERERRLGLLQRQHDSFRELVEQRAALVRQVESAGLALGNLRLDLIKLRSSGLESSFADVSTATQQARALSHDIGVVLDAADEVRRI